MIFGNPTIIASDKEASSVMWNKMWQRVGGESFVPPRRIEPGQIIPSDTTHLIAFGEQSLQYYGNETDLFRYQGRLLESNSYGRSLPICYMQQPSHLLPIYLDPDEEAKSQLYRKPTRFQGIWTHWVQRALKGPQGFPKSPKRNYFVDPSQEVWNAFVEEALSSGLPLSIDIETAYKIKITDEDDQQEVELKTGALLRISFCFKPGYAFSVSWDGRYLPGIKRLLRAALTIWWNGANFDVPRLREEGLTIDGVIHDAMDAWHMLESQLPSGLEFVTTEYTSIEPWKHINNSDFGLYSCIDADAALQNYYGIKADLEHFNMWNLFLEDSVELMPILEKAGHRGNAIDVEYSEALKIELISEKKRLNDEVQPLVPVELLPRVPFVRKPEDDPTRRFVPRMEFREVKVCSACKEIAGNKSVHFKGGKKNPCKLAGGEIVKEIRQVQEWDEILPFNLASHAQIKELINHYGHELGWDRKTERPSANRKHLEKLLVKHSATHPFYKIKIEEAKVSKTLSTYCAVDLVEEDGLLHTHFVNNPWSWRLASTAINMQTWGKRESNPWAKKARRQIAARKGYIFVQADSTSIEAILTGFLISDDEFIQVAKESIHAYLCCQELGIPFNTENIELVKDKYKALYNQFKTAVYLLLYGGDPYLMFMENQELFPSLYDAQLIQQKIFTILPKLEQWQKDLRDKAKKECTVRGIYGHRASFYDVHTFKKHQKDVFKNGVKIASKGDIILDSKGNPIVKLGTDSKSVLSFPAQNGAGKFGRDSLRLIGNSPWGQYMTAACFVHDGYMLEVPDGSDLSIGPDMRFEAEQFLVDVLTREVPEMGNLRIPCESDMGYNWADVDPSKKTFTDGNPLGMKTYRKVMV